MQLRPAGDSGGVEQVAHQCRLAGLNALQELGHALRVDPAQWADDSQSPVFDPVSSHDSGPAQDHGDADFESSDWGDDADDAEGGRKQAAARVQVQCAQAEANRQHAGDMRQAQWQIGPHKGKPYIVAAQAPEQWLGMTRQASKGGWIMGTLFGGLAAFLLWARYGTA